VKTALRRRQILHVDLDPFFVSVERSLDPALRGRALIVGGDGASGGVVAAASAEARAHGVHAGQPLAEARRLCPSGVFRPGDLDAYARASEDVTAVLLSTSRRVERPSADEAFVDLTPDAAHAPHPVSAAERIKDELQRRLRLDASLGLAGTRLAARVASRGARPRGLLVVLPGYEPQFLAAQPLSALAELTESARSALEKAGIETLGQALAADDAALTAAAGAAAATLLRQALQGEAESAVPVAAPPAWIQEEAVVRSRRNDAQSLSQLLEGLVARATRRLRPFDLRAGSVVLEVQRGASALRRSETLEPPCADEETLLAIVARLAGGLLEPAGGVRRLQVRLARLAGPGRQTSLFEGGPLAPASWPL
jgi:DNA polymerase-4